MHPTMERGPTSSVLLLPALEENLISGKAKALCDFWRGQARVRHLHCYLEVNCVFREGNML